MDKAEDTTIIAQQFLPAMMDPILGEYARNVPDARSCVSHPTSRPTAIRFCHVVLVPYLCRVSG